MRGTLSSILPAFSWLASILILAALGTIMAFLIWRGLPSIGLELFFGDTPAIPALLGRYPVFDGIWPACVGTVSLVLLSCGIAIPLGVMSGVYLAEYAPPRARRIMSFGTDVLAGIPSILMGLFGFALILLLRQTLFGGAKTGLWLASLCMAVLVLPYTVNMTRTALQGLPADLRLIGPSLGLSRTESVFSILLPSAARGIMGGVVLSIGRAAEDTAVILLTGVVANAGLPHSVLDKFEALPFRIFYLAAEYRNPHELNQGFGTALVLLCLTSCIFLIAHRLHAAIERRRR